MKAIQLETGWIHKKVTVRCTCNAQIYSPMLRCKLVASSSNHHYSVPAGKAHNTSFSHVSQQSSSRSVPKPKVAIGNQLTAEAQISSWQSQPALSLSSLQIIGRGAWKWLDLALTPLITQCNQKPDTEDLGTAFLGTAAETFNQRLRPSATVSLHQTSVDGFLSSTMVGSLCGTPGLLPPFKQRGVLK